METQPINDTKFTNLLQSATRFYTKGIGVALNQMSRHQITFDDMDYVFVRNDNWSVACGQSDYHEVHKLWAGDWKAIYKRQN